MFVPRLISVVRQRDLNGRSNRYLSFGGRELARQQHRLQQPLDSGDAGPVLNGRFRWTRQAAPDPELTFAVQFSLS